MEPFLFLFSSLTFRPPDASISLSQAIISWRIQQEWPDFTMVGEEDAEALVEGGEGGTQTLEKITALVNKTLRHHKGDAAPELTASDLVELINKGKGSGGKGRHWVLDPVDGTLGFVRGDQYAIALALMEDGVLKVGAMGCPKHAQDGRGARVRLLVHLRILPATGEQDARGRGARMVQGLPVHAVKGEGTFMSPCDASIKADPIPVSVSEAFDPEEAKFCEPVMKANSSQGFTASVADNLGIESKPLRVYSQVKYGSVARADADVFMKFPKAGYKEKIWDHAAGVIIVEEAGGKVTDAGGAPWTGPAVVISTPWTVGSWPPPRRCTSASWTRCPSRGRPRSCDIAAASRVCISGARGVEGGQCLSSLAESGRVDGACNEKTISISRRRSIARARFVRRSDES